MAQTVTCPELVDILNENECLENKAGLGTDIYIGLKSELTAPLTANENTYGTPAFKSGKGLYKVQCADDKEQIQGSSLGYRKGFELTCNFEVDSVSKESGKLARAINNRDIFIIAQDGEESQIMYDPQRKVKFDNGGITTDTGAAASDDRSTKYAAKLSPVNYPNLYVEAPAGGWDSLLAETRKTQTWTAWKDTEGNTDFYTEKATITVGDLATPDGTFITKDNKQVVIENGKVKSYGPKS